jgi:hypothetical protein
MDDDQLRPFAFVASLTIFFVATMANLSHNRP